MRLTHANWKTFNSRSIAPAHSSDVLVALSCDSRDAADALNAAEAACGGTADTNPGQDLGFVYNRSLADPGGHVWGALYMDMSAIPTD